MNNRRGFIKRSTIITAGASFCGFPSVSKPTVSAKSIHEPSRTLPVVHETDVIVCGGGPAGIAAAIKSARQGAKTTLIEMYGCLGGIWTTGLLSYIIDHQNKPGIMEELLDRLNSSDAQYTTQVYDAEFMKFTLDEMCLEAGVNIHLYTRVVAAYKNSKNRLEHIVTESFSGREAWKANIFIDTTGNGELGALAGCRYEVGHPKTGQTQPASLMALLTGIDEEKVVEEGFTPGGGFASEKSKRAFWNEILRAGNEASYTMPTLFAIRPGLIAMMANHQYNVSCMDTKQISKATLEARKEVNQIINRLRDLGGVWSDVRIVATSGQIGIREGRRLQGHYIISSDDLINGARFDDAVCRVTFGVDVHSLDKESGGGYGNQSIKSKPYDIPLRSLIAKDVDGLMMAGRCISGDFFAHASYRVTGNAVAMGEAAGQVAAEAALNDILPQQVDYRP